jgi:hypothetical protein
MNTRINRKFTFLIIDFSLIFVNLSHVSTGFLKQQIRLTVIIYEVE